MDFNEYQKHATETAVFTNFFASFVLAFQCDDIDELTAQQDQYCEMVSIWKDDAAQQDQYCEMVSIWKDDAAQYCEMVSIWKDDAAQYCEMVSIWKDDAARGISPEQRNGWPPYQGDEFCQK